MKNDELVIMGIYPHESQDLVSVVVLSNDGNIQVRSIIQYEGLEAVNFLDDLKNRPLWSYVDAFVIYENLKSKEIISKLEPENKTIIPVCLTPLENNSFESKEASEFRLLLDYIGDKKKSHQIQFPRIPDESTRKLIRQFENFGDGFNSDFDYILNNKDKSGYSIWAFLLACHGMRSLEFNKTIEAVIK